MSDDRIQTHCFSLANSSTSGGKPHRHARGSSGRPTHHHTTRWGWTHSWHSWWTHSRYGHGHSPRWHAHRHTSGRTAVGLSSSYDTFNIGGEPRDRRIQRHKERGRERESERGRQRDGMTQTKKNRDREGRGGKTEEKQKRETARGNLSIGKNLQRASL